MSEHQEHQRSAKASQPDAKDVKDSGKGDVIDCLGDKAMATIKLSLIHI